MTLRRLQRRTVASAVVVCVMVFVPQAFGTVFTYATGTGKIPPVGTPGYDQRDFNRVYHQYGSGWTVYYRAPNGNTYGWVNNALNPTAFTSGYYGADGVRSWCDDENELSPTTWTCQTTRPF